MVYSQFIVRINKSILVDSMSYFSLGVTQSYCSIYEVFGKYYWAVGQQIKVDGKVATASCATFHSLIVLFQQSYPPRNHRGRICKVEAVLNDN